MIRFTKLHGNGNDFILIDEYEGEIIAESNKPAFARKYSHRRFGIGGDGVLFLGNSDKADISMRIFNSDGTEAEMCGNGIRCLVKYALDKGYISNNAKVETKAGILAIHSRINDRVWVTVDMGKPLFKREQIPARGEGEFIGVEMYGHKVSAVNTGVPHAVIMVDSLDNELMKIAPRIRYHSVFLEGANVNFVHIDSKNEITIRTYERGVEAETLSCGTGSVACAAIAHKLGIVGDRVKVNTRGGELIITLTKDKAFMEGSAETVFEGVIQ